MNKDIYNCKVQVTKTYCLNISAPNEAEAKKLLETLDPDVIAEEGGLQRTEVTNRQFLGQGHWY